METDNFPHPRVPKWYYCWRCRHKDNRIALRFFRAAVYAFQNAFIFPGDFVPTRRQNCQVKARVYSHFIILAITLWNQHLLHNYMLKQKLCLPVWSFCPQVGRNKDSDPVLELNLTRNTLMRRKHKEAWNVWMNMGFHKINGLKISNQQYSCDIYKPLLQMGNMIRSITTKN